MRKILFLIFAAMSASQALASYLHMDTTVVTCEQQMSGEIVVPIRAHFNARVEYFYLNVYNDGNFDLVSVEPGRDYPISYLDGNGNEQSYSPTINFTENGTWSEIENRQSGYWDPDGDGTYENYGIVKWEPGDYEEFLLLHFRVPENFWGCYVFLNIEVFATHDARGGTVLENGENGQDFNDMARFERPVTPMPEVTFVEVEDTLIVTFTGEGMLNIDGMDEPSPYSYTLEREYYDQTIEHWVTATGPGKDPSECLYVSYVFKSKIPPKCDPPLIYWNYTDSTMQISVQGLGGGNLIVNGEPVNKPYTVPRAEQDYEVTVSAYAQWGYYLPSDTVTMQLTVPGFNADITPAPTLNIFQALEAYTFSVIGEGEHFLYLNGVRVEEPYVYERPAHGEGDVVIELAWGAKSEGKVMSQMRYTWQWVSEKQKFYDFIEDSVYYLITDEGQVDVVARDSYTYTYHGELVIPDYVTHDGVTYMVTGIGAAAVVGCTDVTSVKIGANVTTIGEDAFASCTGLTEVTLGDYVVNIGKMAFYNSGLQRITMGKGVANIGEDAFRYCRSLNTIICKAATPPAVYNENAFPNYDRPTLYVHPAVAKSYRNHELWSRFANIEAQQWVDPAPGDVSGDGSVDIDDVSSLINRVLNGH